MGPGCEMTARQHLMVMEWTFRDAAGVVGFGSETRVGHHLVGPSPEKVGGAKATQTGPAGR